MNKDRHFQKIYLTQVAEFGQCPIQLFTKKHAERKLNLLAQVGPRLTSADSVLGDTVIKPSEGVLKSERGLVVSHLHTFEDNPIMWMYMDKKSLKVIFKNRDLFEIP